jgi:hypothetical protein
LFTNETCGKSLDIFKDFTCKNGEIAIWYGSNIGRNMVSCDVRSNEKLSSPAVKKTDIQRIQRMMFEHKAAGFFARTSQILWAATPHPCSDWSIEFDDEMTYRQVMIFASSVAFITKLVPKNSKKIWICFANGEHLDRPAGVTKNCPSNKRDGASERVDSTSREADRS